MIRLLLIITVIMKILPVSHASAEELLVIANPAVALETPLTQSQIAAIYLLRMTAWPDGSHIVPVNRELGSAIRDDFTAQVLREDNDSLSDYWNKMHFQGRLPPLVQESEQAMVTFVRNVPGAIGYIRTSTPPLGVKVVGHVP